MFSNMKLFLISILVLVFLTSCSQNFTKHLENDGKNPLREYGKVEIYDCNTNELIDMIIDEKVLTGFKEHVYINASMEMLELKEGLIASYEFTVFEKEEGKSLDELEILFFVITYVDSNYYTIMPYDKALEDNDIEFNILGMTYESSEVIDYLNEFIN